MGDRFAGFAIPFGVGFCANWGGEFRMLAIFRQRFRCRFLLFRGGQEKLLGAKERLTSFHGRSRYRFKAR